MFLALVALNIFHPGHVLRGPDSTFPTQTRAEKKELKARKKAFKMEKKRERQYESQGELVPEATGQEQVDVSNRHYQVRQA